MGNLGAQTGHIRLLLHADPAWGAATFPLLAQLTQKRVKAEYKTLDGTIQTIDRVTKQKSAVNYRCIDMDRTVPMLMGVSKVRQQEAGDLERGGTAIAVWQSRADHHLCAGHPGECHLCASGGQQLAVGRGVGTQEEV